MTSQERTLTIGDLKRVGKYWERNGKRRIYFNDIPGLPNGASIWYDLDAPIGHHYKWGGPISEKQALAVRETIKQMALAPIANPFAKAEMGAPPQPTSEMVSRGQGYGGHPYIVGESIRLKDGRIVTVTKARERYFEEDGLSFGVGDDEGYIYYADVRPATDSERTFLEGRETSVKLKRDKTQAEDMAIKAVKDIVQTKDNYWEPPDRKYPDGERLWTSFVGGQEFSSIIIQPDYVIFRDSGLGADRDEAYWRVRRTPDVDAAIKQYASLSGKEIKPSPKPEEFPSTSELKVSKPSTTSMSGKHPFEPEDVDRIEEVVVKRDDIGPDNLFHKDDVERIRKSTRLRDRSFSRRRGGL